MQSWSTVVLLAGVAGCTFPGQGGADGAGAADAPVIDGTPGKDGGADGATDADREPPPDADPCVAPYVRSAAGCHYFTGLTQIEPGAASICVGASGGGLPIVETIEESIYLGQTALGADTVGRIWIGLNDVAGTWTWRDGTPATFTSWFPGEPSGSGPCTVLRNDGTWGDRPCSDIWSVVCELP